MKKRIMSIITAAAMIVPHTAVFADGIGEAVFYTPSDDVNIGDFTHLIPINGDELDDILNGNNKIDIISDALKNITFRVYNSKVKASGKCGNDISWTLYDDGSLHIYGNGDMWDWDIPANPAPWYSNRELIKTVTIGEGVTSIGTNAFYGCINLANIKLPKSMRAVKDDFSDTEFYKNSSNWYDGSLYVNGCLISARGGSSRYTVPAGTRSIARGAFDGCTEIIAVTIPSSVSDIDDRAFYGCTGLTEIYIPDGVQRIGNYAFYGCEKLADIYMPDSVREVGEYAFGNTAYANNEGNWTDGALYLGKCLLDIDEKLESLTVKSGARVIASAACEGRAELKTAVVPSSVKYIGADVFKNCASLTNVQLPSDLEKIPSGTCSGCVLLPEITVSKSVSEVGENAFDNCTSLGDVYYGGSPSGWSKITVRGGNDNLLGAMIHYAESDPETADSGSLGNDVRWTLDTNGTLTVSGKGEIRDSDFNTVSENINNSVKNIVIENGVTSIGRYAFASYRSVEHIYIPDTVTVIGDGAFFSRELASVHIPDSVTYIGEHAFAGCYNLADITIGSNVMHMGQQAFIGTAYYNDTSNWDDGLLYLGNCLIASDKSITGARDVRDGTRIIGEYALSSLETLTGINLPDSLVCINTGAFNNNNGLTSIEVPDSVTSLERFAFTELGSLKNLKLSNTLKQIPDGAVAKCVKLENIDIPEGVESIGKYAFQGVAARSVKLPSSLKSIGQGAFYDCDNLTDAYYYGSQEAWNRIDIDKTNNQPLLNAVKHFIEPQFNDLSISKAEKRGRNVAVSIFNSKDTDMSVTVLCSAYDEDGVPVGMQFKTIRVAANNPAYVDFEDIITYNSARFKVLAWNALDWMRVVDTAVEVNI